MWPGKAGVSGASDTALLAGLAAAWPEASWQAKGAVSADDFYVLAEGMPAGTRRFDQQGSGLSVYIDPALGRPVKEDAPEPATARGRHFFATEKDIRRYLSIQYGLPQAG